MADETRIVHFGAWKAKKALEEARRKASVSPVKVEKANGYDVIKSAYETMAVRNEAKEKLNGMTLEQLKLAVIYIDYLLS